MTEIESVVARGLVERLLREMRYCLEEIVSIEPVVTGVEYSPQFAQAAGGADIMVVATFDLRVDDSEHRLTFCLPFSGLHPHLVKASAPVPASDRERAQRALAAELLQELMQLFPCARLGTAYGSTEAGLVTFLDHEHQLERPRSCGRALQGVEVRLAGDDGQPAGDGEAGEILVRAGIPGTYTVAAGYLRGDAVEDFTDADGWFADNTDGIALVRDIEANAGMPLAGKRVLLVGAEEGAA